MKRVISLILCLCLVSALSACGNNVTDDKKPADTTLIAPNGAELETENTESSPSTSSEIMKQEESSDNPDTATEEPSESVGGNASEEPEVNRQDEDPLAMLEVKEAFAKNAGGVYLRRNGKLYTLYKYVSEETSEKYNVGWRKSVGWTNCELYLYCEDSAETQLTFGDFDPPALMEGDEIISFGNTGFRMRKYNFVGYSLPICNFPNKFAWIFESFFGMPTELSQYTAKTLEVCDKNGTVQEDYHNLEYGETYTVSWYQGTDYHELKMDATCRCYQPNKQADYQSFDGTITKNGYATYDLSGVEPGLYRIAVGSSVGFIIIE